MGMMNRFFFRIIALFAIVGSLRAAAIDVIPTAEFSKYSEVYRLNIPTKSPGWNTAGVLTGASGYSVNNSASIPIGSFSRVAYYMELSGSTNPNLPNGYVWVSFDAAGFTNRADRIGLPSTTSGEFYQQNISNMTVFSNVVGVLNGSGITTGNIEFWPSNYTVANGRAAGNGGPVTNANNATYDFGDGGASTGGGHGSMQIHNYDLDGAGPGIAGQTLFAYNAWGTVRDSELGIGNNPNTTQAPDWTVTTNAVAAGAWTTRTLQVFVAPIPEPGTIGVLVIGGVLLVMLRRRG
jgi:hypothetical protein